MSESEPETESELTSQRSKQVTIFYNRADIVLLEVKNFMRGARQDDIIIETTSIHEIDKLIEDKQPVTNLLPNNDVTLKNLVHEWLSRAYADYEDVFNKANSDVLSSNRPDIDHKIVLKKDNNLSPSSLYSMSLEQLEMMKTYLENYLQKDFIVSSNTSYASSVLFVKKFEER